MASKKGRVPLEEALKLGTEIADARGKAHRNGIAAAPARLASRSEEHRTTALREAHVRRIYRGVLRAVTS